MSKNLRSMILVLALAVVTLSGLFLPQDAYARSGSDEQTTLVWQASEESGKQVMEAAMEMGGRMQEGNEESLKKYMQNPAKHVSEKEISADEMTELLHSQSQTEQTIIIIIVDDIVIIDTGDIIIIIIFV